mgnify:CR=1 FL=1
MKGKVMNEQEVKIIMDENGRLYIELEDGSRLILVPYDRNGVFAE